MARLCHPFTQHLLLCSALLYLFLPGCYAPNHIRIGNRYLKSNQYEKALDSFSKARENQPSNWLVYNRLGWSYYNLGKYEDAVKQFTTSLAMQDDWGSHEGLGESYFALQQYEKSLIQYSKWSAAQPRNGLPHSRSGWANFYLGKFDEAVKGGLWGRLCFYAFQFGFHLL